MELKEKGDKMTILRLYLGEIVSLALAIAIVLVAAAVANRYFPNPRIRTIRNVCISLAIAVFAGSLASSLVVNQTPRGKIDRAGADQDQKQFDLRHQAR